MIKNREKLKELIGRIEKLRELRSQAEMAEKAFNEEYVEFLKAEGVKEPFSVPELIAHMVDA